MDGKKTPKKAGRSKPAAKPKKAKKKAPAKKASPKKAMPEKVSAKPKAAPTKKPAAKQKSVAKKGAAKPTAVHKTKPGGVKALAIPGTEPAVPQVVEEDFFDVPVGSTFRLQVEVEGSGVLFLNAKLKKGATTTLETWSNDQVENGEVEADLEDAGIYIFRLRIRFTNGPATVRGQVSVGPDTRPFEVEGQAPDPVSLRVGISVVQE